MIHDHTLIAEINISIEFTEIFYSRRSIFLDILLMIRKESYKVHRGEMAREKSIKTKDLNTFILKKNSNPFEGEEQFFFDSFQGLDANSFK